MKILPESIPTGVPLNWFSKMGFNKCAYIRMHYNRISFNIIYKNNMYVFMFMQIYLSYCAIQCKQKIWKFFWFEKIVRIAPIWFNRFEPIGLNSLQALCSIIPYAFKPFALWPTQFFIPLSHNGTFSNQLLNSFIITFHLTMSLFIYERIYKNTSKCVKYIGININNFCELKVRMVCAIVIFLISAVFTHCPSFVLHNFFQSFANRSRNMPRRKRAPNEWWI